MTTGGYVDGLGEFNSLPAERLTRELTAVCAAPAWGAAVLAGRPYASRTDLLAAADAASAALTWDDVLQGLSAHPRIGERAQGDTAEAAWSRREQSTAAQTADDVTRAELVAANRAYEEKFGHVFLIFASGRSQAEILAAARERLSSDPAAEQRVVAGELGKIARLRLARLVPFHVSTHVLDTVTGAPATGVPVTLQPSGAPGVTDGDGRLRFDVAEAGDYRLEFDVAAHLGPDAFFPSATVTFRIADTDRNYHVPLLLSRFGYTTYRGS
ncbi:2-oxo-4-hydroxy-4-carboxy-5-ureidoimidazoline decarboxylase [Symbioplanes lichenis]|uniref:2-oxo-4-hydroxy-4-carboxy-5-ureidoimidazoline decarboxylase n=1 Tax=Symbioplanes lichenis TaxID=1629072 RepID=UPI002739E47B|nr:2-oxo-4-hydroxy-4-carboxy-5-ureidoimidazoline decarboxylase [Actinoplanes lichenis]